MTNSNSLPKDLGQHVVHEDGPASLASSILTDTITKALPASFLRLPPVKGARPPSDLTSL